MHCPQCVGGSEGITWPTELSIKLEKYEIEDQPPDVDTYAIEVKMIQGL